MKSSDKEKLLREAELVKVNAFAPYSKFRVGCAILLKNSEIYSGANIESSSYVCGICAERNALSTVYGKGYRKEDVVAIALCSDSKEFITPCGMCRQLICELVDPDVTLFLMNQKREVKEIKVRKLLPYLFNDEILKG